MVTTAKVELTPDNLLDLVRQMNEGQFEQFFRQMVTLRSRNIASTVSESEEALIKRIYSYRLSPTEHGRLLELAKKSERETLTDKAEWAEYGVLVDKSEMLNVKRIRSAVELSALREQSLDETLDQLGLLNKRGASNPRKEATTRRRSCE